MKKNIVTILLLVFCLLPSSAQNSQNAFQERLVIQFDEKTHDFGDILLSDGPVTCSFSFKNVSDKPFNIHQVASSCGCTNPVWPKAPIRPGETGKIDVTFNNDQGPYPFEKTLTVYVSSLDRPVILRVKGEAHERKKDIAEIYSIRFGQLGMRKDTFTMGYIDQGMAKSDGADIVNFSKSPVKVAFVPESEGFSAVISPNPVPAGGKARVTWTVDTKTISPKIWGSNTFKGGFSVAGKRVPGGISVTSVVKDNFSSMTKEQMEKAGCPVLEQSYWEFKEVRRGTVVEAQFKIRNKGREKLVIHQIAAKGKGFTILTKCPLEIASGAVSTVKVKFDTSTYDGEVVEILSVITNSPAKPIINLFVSGNVIN